MRKASKTVYVGGIPVGGGNRVSIQSMTNTDTRDVEASLAQIERLRAAGCDIVRLAVPDAGAAEAFGEIRRRCDSLPLVADIHFDYRIAVRCAELGADKIRINPGNIGGKEKVAAVARICRERRIPIRIGVNGGSLEKDLAEKYGGPSPEALYESAMRHAGLLNEFDFDDIVISVKSSSVSDAVAANRYVAEKCGYPLHVGVTEAGPRRMGIIKNAAALGALLPEGIGDTVRISLTDDPVEEVLAARDILRSLSMPGHSGMDIVSCPTCGRTQIPLISLVKDFEEAAKREGLLSIPVKVAIMGCAVNGPGEASGADVGIAGGRGEALLFEHGRIIGKIGGDSVVSALVDYIKENFKDR
ncbi:MAG: flavodoxin-dependent (E)-4-hydroxy-3-methylbut-2-enyl-diphosphate synthase [Clostridia bacterium]|nr:flavodoxin-dependent (E)-4-hydroxy-3-methylbut-2-enyl-diphosphate synthase [Clostridia bacterium]